MSFLKEPKIFMREKCEVSSSILLTYQQRVLLPVVLGELGQKPKTRFDCFKMKFSKVWNKKNETISPLPFS